MDQAQQLREYMKRHHSPKTARVITVTSGKGGVGKSNFVLNFALGLQRRGKKVVLFDLDFTMANLNVLMGIQPTYTLRDVLFKQKNIWDILEKGSEGIEYVVAGLDLDDLLGMDENQLKYFLQQIEQLQSYADYILLDTGAGVSKETLRFIAASNEVILVTNPEPLQRAPTA